MTKSLKYTESLTRYINYKDFNKFIKEVYGQDFCFLSTHETSNDSSYIFQAKKGDLSDWDLVDLGKFIDTGETDCCLIHALFNDLCNKGLIPEGDYVISVCW